MDFLDSGRLGQNFGPFLRLRRPDYDAYDAILLPRIFSCPVVTFYFYSNPVRGLASTASLFRGCSLAPPVEFASLAAGGPRGGVENGDFCMLSGLPPAPGAENAISGFVPTSPESL